MSIEMSSSEQSKASSENAAVTIAQRSAARTDSGEELVDHPRQEDQPSCLQRQGVSRAPHYNGPRTVMPAEQRRAEQISWLRCTVPVRSPTMLPVGTSRKVRCEATSKQRRSETRTVI